MTTGNYCFLYEGANSISIVDFSSVLTKDDSINNTRTHCLQELCLGIGVGAILTMSRGWVTVSP